MNNSDPPSSRQCPNCGTQLIGRFCSNCGQEDHSLAVPLYRLILDFLSDQFQFDSRIGRTLGLLLFRPGRLTRNYMSGQRQRYIPPIRLYLFVTIVFFLTVGFLPIKKIPVTVHGPNLHIPAAATAAAPASAGGTASSAALNNVGQLIERSVAESAHTQTPAAASADKAARNWFLPRLEALQKKPGEFMKRFWSNMPKVLFFLIPVFALLLKLLYLLRKRYYSEHLIFALHYHSALFIYLLAVVLLTLLAGVSPPILGAILRWCCLALGIWSVIYVFPAMRVAYADTWPRVVSRGAVLWFAYSIALFSGTLTAVSIAFVAS